MLSESNEADLARFFCESKKIDREYNVSLTQIANSMLAETLQRELKRFKRKKP
jgi:hypothetical protein